MSAMQRSNGGQADERKAVALVREPSGWDVRRRVRQHDSDRPWADYTWTVEGSVEAWAATAREVQGITHGRAPAPASTEELLP